MLDEIVDVLTMRRGIETLRVDHLLLLVDVIDDQIELVDTVVKGCQNVVRDAMIKMGLIHLSLSKEDTRRAAIYGIFQYMDRDGTLTFRLTPRRAAPLVGDPAREEEE